MHVIELKMKFIMITKEQCRAARSFLGIKQADLANLCGMSKTAITHFESGLFTPRADNMAAIRAALEGLGIEFIGTTGVQKKETTSRVLEGKNMHPELWDDIFDTLRHKGGEVCIAYFSEKEAYNEHKEKLESHMERLKQYNISERLLMCEGDDFFVQDPKCYRWLPYNVYKAGATFFVYGSKSAILFWDGSIAMIFENKLIAQQEQARFDYLWEIAHPPYQR